MPEQKKLPIAKVLPLFGSGDPMCWCGAPAKSSGQYLVKIHATLCRAHWLSEKQLQAAAIARADAALARHFKSCE